MQDLALEGAAGGLGLGLVPVDACGAASFVAAVGVFPAVDDDARVEQRGAEEPER